MLVDFPVTEDGPDALRVELVAPEQTLLAEIADRSLHQKDVAQTIRLLLEWEQTDEVDWPRIRAACVRRWSRSGWLRIKRLAETGRCFPSEPEA